MRTAPRHAAFTLIELLVVIAIISILATLLFTALSGSRMRSNQATSLNNLKQWSAALQRSLQDHENQLPSTGVVAGATNVEDEAAWFNRLPPYMGLLPLRHPDYKTKPPRPGDRSLWMNPAVSREEGDRYIEPPARFLFCYGMNYFLTTTPREGSQSEPTQLASRIENPAGTVFMAETAGDKAVIKPEEIRAYFGPGDTLKEVKNGAHFLFFDGHVEMRTRDKFDPAHFKASHDDPSPIDAENVNRHFTFVPYQGAIAVP